MPWSSRCASKFGVMARLDRAAQNAAACWFNHERLPVLDRAVKPDDDS